MLRFYTAGESHGKGLVGFIEGIPAGLPISEDKINLDLARRQQGPGRGGRMQIEKDRIEICSGVRNCLTLGSPISFIIYNQDHKNWEEIMSPGICTRMEEKAVKRPRPGHADLPGAMKYNHSDMRNILERASARETAARVAIGSFCKQLLAGLNIYIYSEVTAIGSVKYPGFLPQTSDFEIYNQEVESSPVRCGNKEVEEAMLKIIAQAADSGETLGGCFLVAAQGVPPGLGSYNSWERRLDSRVAQLMMSIPAIKAVEIGDGAENAGKFGSEVHDEIYYNEELGVNRRTNRAGGIEGGISNGEIVWVRAYMKPIPTLMKPLNSINTQLWYEEKAVIERSDTCAVPAASIVGEAMLACAIAEKAMEKFGGDSFGEVKERMISYRDYLEKVWKWKKI